MIRLKLLLSALALFLGTVQGFSQEASKMELDRYVASGKKQQIWFMINSLQADCSSTGQSEAQIILKPEHGSLEFVTGKHVIRFPKDFDLVKCNGMPLPGTFLYYTPNRGFVGADEVEVFAIYPDGSAAQRQFHLHVR